MSFIDIYIIPTIRTDASNRQAAAISTGFLYDLIDVGILPEGSNYPAVDAKKIHRARESVIANIQAREEKRLEEEDIEAIMVDSRLTKTKVRSFNEKTGKYYNSIEKQDLYTMTDENGKFLGHFVKEPLPEGSTMTPSESVALRIYQWCLLYGVDTTLKFIAGDSTNSNTGYKGGAFHFLEKYLN